MRILVITEAYPPCSPNGYALACQRTVDELSVRGHLVRVLTSHSTQQFTDAPMVTRVLNRVPPLGILPLTLGYLCRQLYRAKQLRLNREIVARASESFRPDIVFIWQSEGVGIGVAAAAERIGIPVVHRRDDCAFADLLIRLYSDPSPLRRFARCWLYNVARRRYLPQLMVVSKFLFQKHNEAGVPPENIVVTPNGVPRYFLNKKGPPEYAGDTIRLLFVGRVCDDKGVHLALRALQKLKIKTSIKAQLDIVGPVEAEYGTMLAELTDSLGLRNSVRMLGSYPPEELLGVYDRCHALVFPSVAPEGFGLTLIEAMSRGLPVVAFDHSAASEIVVDGANGFLIENGDVDAFADAIATIFRCKSKYQQMAWNAYETVHQNFTLQHSVDLIEARLRQLVTSTATAEAIAVRAHGLRPQTTATDGKAILCPLSQDSRV